MAQKIGIIGYALVGYEDEVKLRSDELVFHATRKALDTAGITREDLGSSVITSLDAYDGITISNGLQAPAAGGYEKDATRIQGGGVGAIFSAFASILSKSAEFAVVAGADATMFEDPMVSNTSYDLFFRRDVGMFNLPSYALVSTALLNREGVTEKDFALLAAKNYEAAAGNPHAHRKTAYSADEVLASSMVFWPLRELEIGPISKGGAALVLASEEKTKEITDDPIWITGIGGGSNQYYGGWSDLMEMKGLKRAAQAAYKMAGVKDPASEINAVEVHNPFAPFELLAYEALGLCGEGRALDLLHTGVTSSGGYKPVNASGGALGTNPLSSGGIFRSIQAAEYLKQNGRTGKVVSQDSDINLGFFGETYHVLVMERG